MAQRITAWRGPDGGLYETEEDALKAEARVALHKLRIFQHPTIDTIIEHQAEIMAILRALPRNYAGLAPSAGSLEQRPFEPTSSTETD